jgi:hypothetical protein
MTFSDVVREILTSTSQPMSPQEIRAVIKEKYSPQYYGTQSHINNVEKGHYKDIDHALLAQIYTLVGTSDSFFCDKSQKPMRISLFSDRTEPTPSIEDFETDEGFVYILKTDTYTKEGKEIIKIGFTAQDINQRINQLYTTGVPFKFKVHAVYQTKNFIGLETALHKLLDPFKLNKSREFFIEDALAYIEKIIELHKAIQGEV